MCEKSMYLWFRMFTMCAKQKCDVQWKGDSKRFEVMAAEDISTTTLSTSTYHMAYLRLVVEWVDVSDVRHR